jgi:hypothetical protein
MKKNLWNCSNLPEKDKSRSSRAKAVVDFAQRKDLGVFHFEMRNQLEEPEAWDTGLADDYRWNKGYLHEGKYSAFKTDCLLASFQPGHRSQWSSHELLHNIVGFSWAENASLFYHALSSRLSELLPVALFYFFDEIDSKKCERHRFSSALFGEFCKDCESVKAISDKPNPFFLEQAKIFVENEIAAVKKSIHTGMMYENVFCGLNLTSDAMQFARMQYPRLSDPICKALYLDYYKGQSLVHSDLESLFHRLELVFEALLENDFSNLENEVMPSKEKAIALDIVSRLFLMKKHVEEDRELIKKIDSLIESEFASLLETNYESCIQKYGELCDEYQLIPTEDMFAVGIALNNTMGLCFSQIEDGLSSSVPLSFEKWQKSPNYCSEISEFMHSMNLERTDLGDRLAKYFQTKNHDLKAVLDKELSLYGSPRGDLSHKYLGDTLHIEGKALKWNTDLSQQSLSGNELYELGVFEEGDSHNYVLLSLPNTGDQPNSLYPLEVSEHESLVSFVETGILEESLYSLVKDLLENGFLLEEKWSLYNA